MSLLVTTTLLPHSNDTELIMYGHYHIRGKRNTQVTVNTNQITMIGWWTPCCHHSRHHVMSEVLLLLLPTESLKLRPDPSVDIWVAGAPSQWPVVTRREPIMCCPSLSATYCESVAAKTCIIAPTASQTPRSKAQCTPAHHHRRETVRLRLELERLTTTFYDGFSRLHF